MLDLLNLILSILLFTLLVLYFRLNRRTTSNKKRVDVIADRELDIRMFGVEGDLQSSIEHVNTLKGEISKLQTEILKLATERNLITSDIERAYTTIDSMQEKIAELEVSIQNISNQK